MYDFLENVDESLHAFIYIHSNNVENQIFPIFLSADRPRLNSCTQCLDLEAKLFDTPFVCLKTTKRAKIFTK